MVFQIIVIIYLMNYYIHYNYFLYDKNQKYAFYQINENENQL